eukprot:scaffold7624_cov248-Pinguiococcus_pyrenoidosus.AAC.14
MAHSAVHLIEAEPASAEEPAAAAAPAAGSAACPRGSSFRFLPWAPRPSRWPPFGPIHLQHWRHWLRGRGLQWLVDLAACALPEAQG